MTDKKRLSFLDQLIKACLENKLITFLALGAMLTWGVMVAPFDWHIPGLERDPVPVDAIPDIGENQQIVFTRWPGRSPQDVEDQVTYPLTVALMGLSDVRTVRSYSMFGFSTIYVIFKEKAAFYGSRSRILEKLNALPPGTLPGGVSPALGPDATALGQIFWYTLEGRDAEGRPAGGWDLQELRSIQDWYVRYGLQSADGVAEVASVGGFVKEYQIDVDPAALRQHGVPLGDVIQAVRASNVDVGARTIEVNKVEYEVRGIGFIKSIADVENTVVASRNHVPLFVKDVAQVSLGPALRRGALDKEGAEAVGGVVVVRYGENPLAAIQNVKAKIAELAPGLPSKVLDDGRVSQVTIIPFYDRSGLIYETLGTLNHALRDEILITVIVVLIMLLHLSSSLLISTLLPMTVLLVFVGMKHLGVDANVVALSGIAIAIGTIVDMGIVVSENILKHLDEAPEDVNRGEVIFRATTEVSGAVLTAVSTTVISFLPVFFMTAAEGKLFRPLAYTKTLALAASVVLALTVLPSLAHLLLGKKTRSPRWRQMWSVLLVAVGLAVMPLWSWSLGGVILLFGVFNLIRRRLPKRAQMQWPTWINWAIIIVVTAILAGTWAPLGLGRSGILNFIFAAIIIGGVMGGVWLFTRHYPRLLRLALDHKVKALAAPAVLVIMGAMVWFGFGRIWGFMPDFIQKTRPYQKMAHVFPGLGREFMPPLDEGSFLYMPTTMPHAGMEESYDVLRKLDMALYSVPEVETVVGKLGRAETPLDPAPISMVETLVNYKPEYVSDKNGKPLRFKVDGEGDFVRDEDGQLVPHRRGKLFRNWRDHIHTADDIWNELVKVASIPGTTSAPRLQPISARLVMLQSGMRAPMGIKVKGPDLERIDRVALALERLLRQVPSIKTEAVLADRVVGKPYLEIEIDRLATARYGLPVSQVQDVIETAIGGKTLTTTLEGRARYPVRVRYMRELRGDMESLERILVSSKDGVKVPLGQLARIRYVRGPQMIKSEDTFLVGYVLFDRRAGWAEVDVVEQAQAYLKKKIDSGELQIPAGVSYSFAGSYENQLRAARRMRLVLPLALLLIFMILYFQFKRASTTLIVFSGIFVAWAGGFVMLWLWAQPWFMDFSFAGVSIRSLFQMHPINLSIAVWVGFLALFGIATDDGVLISTYLKQRFDAVKPKNIAEIREAAVYAGARRIRPAMMTTATTVLALIPILTATGRGADVMVPMAIPSFGGMVFEVLTVFVVPVLYTWREERRLLKTAD